jgi:hypothetical protein
LNDLCGWSCLGGVAVGLGFVGLFLLLFSPRVVVPFWLFASFSVCLAASLGAFLGIALDIILRNSAPILTAVGVCAGMAVGAYYAIGVYRTPSSP